MASTLVLVQAVVWSCHPRALHTGKVRAVVVFPSDAELSRLYEAIGRGVAHFAKLEHVAIELSMVWDDERTQYGAGLANVRDYILARMKTDPRRDLVKRLLAPAEELTSERNAIVHGVWFEAQIDDSGRYFAVRTLPTEQALKQEHPEYLHGIAKSTDQLLNFAARCEEILRALGVLRDDVNAERSSAEQSET